MAAHTLYFQVLLLLHIFSSLSSLRCCNIATSRDGAGLSKATLAAADTANSSALSLCLWVNASTYLEQPVLSLASPNGAIPLTITTSKVRLFSPANLDPGPSLHYTLMPNISSYLCVTWEPAGKGLSVHLDGVLQAQNDSAGFQDLKIPLSGNWTVGSGLQGSVCGITLWDRVIPANDFYDLYESGMAEVGSVENSTDEDGMSKKAVPVMMSWANFTHENYTSVDNTYCEREKSRGIRLGSLDPVASKFVILFLVIIGVIVGFAALFLCSEREIAMKRAEKGTKEDRISIDSTHSVT